MMFVIALNLSSFLLHWAMTLEAYCRFVLHVGTLSVEQIETV